VRKIAYSALILIILMPSMGYFLILKVQQYFARVEMVEALNSDLVKTEKITLSVSDFRKIRVDTHEILFRNKMYDIKSFALAGDSVELLVINDIQEEKILEQINDLISKTHRQHHNLPGQLINLLNLIYIIPGAGNEYAFKAAHTRFPYFCEPIGPAQHDVTSPPPKIA
jgi:hypothetical protein